MHSNKLLVVAAHVRNRSGNNEINRGFQCAAIESNQSAALTLEHVGPTDKATVTMHFERSTAAFGAERRSTVSNVSIKNRVMAALVVACLASFGTMQANAENLLLKNSDGSTITQIPLTTSQGCTVVGGGDIEVRPQPTSGTAGDGWCPQGVAVGPPTFSAGLAVSPLSVVQGNPVSATWTSTSSVAWTCTGTATVGGLGTNVVGWTGARATSQTASGLSFTPAALGPHVFMITCTNSAGSTTSTALTVEVTPPGDCPGNFPPSYGLTRQTSMTNSNSSYLGNSELPNGAMSLLYYDIISNPWPSRVGNGTIAIMAGRFVALEFNTGTMNSATYGGSVSAPNRFGSLETASAQGNNGQVLLSISECPGDFEHLPGSTINQLCRGGPSGAWQFIWGVTTTDPFACNLQANRKYYLNAAFFDPTSQQSTCGVQQAVAPQPNPTACQWFVQTR